MLLSLLMDLWNCLFYNLPSAIMIPISIPVIIERTIKLIKTILPIVRTEVQRKWVFCKMK